MRCLHPLPLPAKIFSPLAPKPYVAPTRAGDSDSDSEYGARSKKKKRPRQSLDDSLRISSRGGKIPNYIDDVENYAQFEEEEDSGYYAADTNAQYEEEHEIEAVYYHFRDETRLDDPDDIWQDNVVGLYLRSRLNFVRVAEPY